MAQDRLSQQDARLLSETHEKVSELRAVVVGLNGDDGLCGEIRRIARRMEDIANSLTARQNALDAQHHKLSRNFWLLVGTLAGSGVIAGSVLGALQ